MIGETTVYPKIAPQAINCYQCFNTICQGINAGASFIFQNGVAHRTIQEQNACNATDYFWRKYYSDLAMGFSTPIPTYFKQCCRLENNEKTAALQHVLSSRESEQKCTKNVEIWRPFSPTPQRYESYENNSQTVLPRSSLPIIPSIKKLDHSTSSVFVPVQKKSHIFPKCPSTLHSTPMRGYLGSKPFACDYPNCFKSFARNEELTRHRRIHSGYKPHHCNSCGKSFGRKDHLSKHLKTHLQVSEKKVYLCRVPGCGHRYTRSDALTRHKSNAHATPKSPSVAKISTKENKTDPI